MDGKVSRLVTVEVVDPVPGSLDSLLKVGLNVLEGEEVMKELAVMFGKTVVTEVYVYVKILVPTAVAVGAVVLPAVTGEPSLLVADERTPVLKIIEKE